MYQISDEGIECLKLLEGYKSTWYGDSEGNPTIGYGHLKEKGDYFESLTPEEAEIILRKDIEEVEDYLNTLDLELEQNEYDALVCLVFNIGQGQFSKSTVLKMIRLNDDINTLTHWADWVYVNIGGIKQKNKGLANRRRAEMTLFNKIDNFMTEDQIIQLTTILDKNFNHTEET